MTPEVPHAQNLAPTGLRSRLRATPQLGRLLRRVDEADVAATTGAARVRRIASLMIIAYAGLLTTLSALRGHPPSVSFGLMAVVGLAVYKNMLGRFVRDWTLVFGGLFAYVASGHFQPAFNLPVHYKPQLEADKLLGFGQVPSVWLQEHLYHGKTGPLEIYTTLMYLSHFFAPLILGLLIWFMGRRRAFNELMFGILLTSILADITFVLLPTAPPWLAADHGYMPPVHHIVKQGLLAMHMDGLAAMDGDASRYNVVAALPSMHAAFPVVAMIVVLRHRLPRWIAVLQGLQVAGVFFAVVYSGEHYVSDVFAGAAYAALACVVVSRALDRMPRRLRVRSPVIPPSAAPVPVRVGSDPQ